MAGLLENKGPHRGPMKNSAVSEEGMADETYDALDGSRGFHRGLSLPAGSHEDVCVSRNRVHYLHTYVLITYLPNLPTYIHTCVRTYVCT